MLKIKKNLIIQQQIPKKKNLKYRKGMKNMMRRKKEF